MHNSFARFFIFFLALTGAFTLIMQLFNWEFGYENYWDNRGMVFLFFVTLFPRLTLLFSSVAFGGFLWWLGFIFAPRILIAVLATIAYWEMNPFLVIVSWIVAFSGESSEKYVLTDRVQIVSAGGSPFVVRSGFGSADKAGTTIEGEYRRKD